MKKGELEASALLDKAMDKLKRSGAISRVHGTLNSGKPTTEFDPNHAEEALTHALDTLQASGKYTALIQDISFHVDDPFQRAELGRLSAHLQAIEEVSLRSSRLLGRTQDTGRVNALMEDERLHREALERAVQSVLSSAPLRGNSYENISSRIAVALTTRMLAEALATETDRIHVPSFGELTPTGARLAQRRVDDAVALLSKFAKGF